MSAILLRKHGWKVYATCRSKKDCSFFLDRSIESFPLDLASEKSISLAVAFLENKTKGQLDAIFNNGAFATPGAVEDIPRDALREIFEVNVFGQFDLIQKCLPLLYKSQDPRIINCSSVLGFLSLPYRGSY